MLEDLPHDHRRPMRRTDREMTPKEALELLRRTPNAVMATADGEGRPYGVPVTVAFVEGVFYVHGTSAGGRRSSNLTENPFASLTFVVEGGWDAEPYSLFYASVIVDGRARMVTDPEEKTAALFALADVCGRERPHEHKRAYIESMADAVEVWAIEPERISGKRRAPKA